MFYGNTMHDIRKHFFISWAKYRQKKPLSSLEQQLADVIAEHPEYHDLFDKIELADAPEKIQTLAEQNPFLHLGLHLTIRDQIAINRPEKISQIYRFLIKKHKNKHAVEHLLIEPLLECLESAQIKGVAPNELDFLSRCESLI